MTSTSPVSNTEFVFPASFAQQRLWFLNCLAPGNPFYNVSAAIRLTGQLNITALEQTFNEIVRRHEVLRTTFEMSQGQLNQVIVEDATISVPVVDLRSLPASEREETARQQAKARSQLPFDLTADIMLRVSVFQLDAADRILLLNLHHISADGWSIGILLREIGILYTAFNAGKRSPLPLLPIQYADFAHWQREWLQGQVLESQMSYWRQQLANLPVLNLPTDRTRPHVQTYRGATHNLELSKTLTAQLEALSQQEGVTLFMTLLAAFQTLLYRYTGQEDIVVGSPIANRNRAELEALIGFFVNSLVLRIDLSGNPTFRQLLERVRKVTLEAYAHQDLPFEKLVQELHPEREGSRHPLFQVAIALQNTPITALELPGLTLSQFDFDPATSRLDLEFHLWQSPEGLKGQVIYSTDLFDRSTITRMLGHFQTLLEGIVINLDQTLAYLPILTATERHQLLVEFNQNQSKIQNPSWKVWRREVAGGILPPANFGDGNRHRQLSAKSKIEQCIHQLFESHSSQTPEAIAVVYGDEQLTYQELNRRSNKIAHYLQKLGVAPEVKVGICVERSLEMIVGILGILKAGGAYVPLDPIYPPERLKFMLEDAQISVLLTQQSFRLGTTEQDIETQEANEPLNLIQNPSWKVWQDGNRHCHATPLNAGNPRTGEAQLSAKSKIQNLRVVCLERDREIITQQSEENPTSNVTCANIAYVIYTSGSTGQPKGVLVEHHGLCNLVQAQIQTFDLKRENRILQFASLSFDASIFEIVMALGVGATLYLIPEEARLGAALISYLQNNAITHATLPPAVLKTLPPTKLPALQVLISAGEACSPDVARWANTRRLFNAYGLTETTVWSTVAQVKDSSCTTIGRAIANTQIYVLDAYLQPVAIGIPGELYIGGVGVARGYLNRPDLTDQRFITNPFLGEGQRSRGAEGQREVRAEVSSDRNFVRERGRGAEEQGRRGSGGETSIQYSKSQIQNSLAPSLIQMRSRAGLIAKAQIVGDSNRSVQVGQLVQEAVRVLPRNIHLTIALDPSLERIERVDATSAFAAIPYVSLITSKEQLTDYVFGRVPEAKPPETPTTLLSASSASRYGLFSLDQKLILNSAGELGEAVKVAVQRLSPKLQTLLAAKLWRLTTNEGSSLLNVKATLEIIDAPNQVLIQRETQRSQKHEPINASKQSKKLFSTPLGADFSNIPVIKTSRSNPPLQSTSSDSIPIPIGSRIQYRVHNNGDRTVYLLLLGLDSSKNAIALFSGKPDPTINDTNSKPLLLDVAIAPGQTIIVPQTAVDFEWVIHKPTGLAEHQLIFSSAKFTTTLAALGLALQTRENQQYIGALSNPLEVAQAMMQDLHNASAILAQATTASNTAEAITSTADTYSLDVNQWASLSFVYQVA